MNILSLKNMDLSHVGTAGGKGASLGELLKAGILVPPGFVVLTDAFERFLDETKLREEVRHELNGVDNEKIHTVEHASETIQSFILKAKMPADLAKEITNAFQALNTPFVAVRSSATAEDSSSAAWAGQLDSFLNTTADNLLENVKRCWASLFTPRAIFYRFEQGLHNSHVSVAVVVQEMVNSEKSGIAFSVHPVTEDHNQMIVEAGYGLGEAIVSGQITPDAYVVSKKDDAMISVDVHEQKKGLFRKENGGNEWKNLPKGGEQVLTEEEIIELGNLIKRIEDHYGFPCDIEWAYTNDNFYITQSRPITTLKGEPTQQNSIQYIRMFEVTGMPFLLQSIFLTHYNPLKVVTVFQDNHWTSYLPKESEQYTLTEGVKLFGSKKAFTNYVCAFNEYKTDSTKFFEELIAQNKITKGELTTFFSIMADFWLYYMKTEFFFVDAAYMRSKEDKLLVENLKQLEDVKNTGRECMNKMIFGSESYLNKTMIILSKQFSVPLDDLLWSSKKELLSQYENKPLSSKKIFSRRDAYAFLTDNDKIVIKEGTEAREFISSFVVESTSGSLKGICANPGKVTAKAKVIVFGTDTFDKFSQFMEEMDEGDVLVTETTSPEFMIACKKASAIVTNQGGLLSHAAIVSRELNIPCLIGVETATHMIKDGDFIEVDADKGVVRKIE